MVYKRIIGRIDIKGPNAIKGIQMDGLRVVGSVQDVATSMYQDGVDELLFLDIVASLYDREHMIELIRSVTSTCFVPVTVGGGIKTLSEANSLFRAGADKVAINSALFTNLGLVESIASKYGSQAVVAQIDAKQTENHEYECYKDGGRERTHHNVGRWVSRVFNSGAGEILLSSVDRDGTRSGFDMELVNSVASTVSIPVVASSGAGCPAHVVEVLTSKGISGVAIGAAFHWKSMSVENCRNACIEAGVQVREIWNQ